MENGFFKKNIDPDLHVKPLHQPPSIAGAAHQTHSVRGLVNHGAQLGSIRWTWQKNKKNELCQL